MVRPVGIVAEHGRRDAEAQEDLVVAAQRVRCRFRLPVIVSAGAGEQTRIARLLHHVFEQRVEE